MSVLTSVLSFALVAGLVTIIPGLDTAMVLRSAITDGRRQGFATALGICSGCLAWGAAAAVGMSALLTASTVAYTTLRIAGAIYMIWLGTRLLCRAVRGRAGEEGPRQPVPADAGLARSWNRGLMTNLLNPKIGAFYLAVMPQFIPAHTSHLAVGLLLALVHDLEGILWFSVLILGTHGLRATLARRSTQRTVDGLTGTALVGFGIRLGLASR